MNCPECNQPMQNLGNISGVIYTSYPPQWDETYACHTCKRKESKRVSGKNMFTDYSFLNDYK